MAKFELRHNAPEILCAIANSERSFAIWVASIDALMYKADLPAGDREVAVLRLAALTQSRYEWVEHSKIAAATDVSLEAMNALLVLDGSDHLRDLLTSSQLLAVVIVDSVFSREGPGISDDLWAEARSTWGDSGAFDLIFSIAWWGGMVPLLLRMLRL
jgi:alkylhydroperoxidase family enzyme